MEQVKTTAMIGTIVGYLAKTLKENKSVKDFFNDFTDASVKWIRPLFLKNENLYEKIIEDLLKKPENPSETKLKLVENTIASHLEDNPADEQHLRAMYEQLQEKAKSDSSIHIQGDGNKVYSNINNSTSTDNSINQTHYGIGDNVVRDKITGK